MKSYKDLTLRYLRNQLKRTLLTILGVILSIALITAIGTMLESLKQQSIEEAMKSSGNFHTSISGLNFEQINVLNSHLYVEKSGFEVTGGFAKTPKNSYVRLFASNSVYQQMLYISLAEGRLPQTKGEIALEKWALRELGEDLKVGDSITLDMMDVSEDEVLDVVFKKNPDVTEVQNKEAVRLELTISGVLENNSESRLKSIARGIVAPELIEELKGKSFAGYKTYILIKDKKAIQEGIGEVCKSLGMEKSNAKDNSRLLYMLGQSRDKQTNDSVLYVTIFLTGLIVAATAAVIYNAFHISVLERIKQFGVLRAVGTTPGQIRAIVFGEVLIVLLISLPLGLLSGVLAVKMVLALLNLSRHSFFIGVNVVLSGKVLASSALVGAASVFLSALSPAFLAGRVSPIEAIMNNRSHKRLMKKPKSYKLIRGILGVEGEMACKNLKRNQKRFFITVFSMCIGITVFIVFSTFAHYTFEGLHGKDGFIGDYGLYSTKDDGTQIYDYKDYEAIKGIEGIKEIYKTSHMQAAVTYSISKLTDEYKREMEHYGLEIKPIGNTDNLKPITSSLLSSYDEKGMERAREVLQDGTTDIEAINREMGVLIVQNKEINRSKDGKQSIIKASNLRVGDYIYVDITSGLMGEKQDLNSVQKLKVVGVLDKLPIGEPYPKFSVPVVTTEEVYRKITGKTGISSFDIFVEKGANKEKIREELFKLSEKDKSGMLVDFGEMAAELNQIKLSLSVLLYGFVAVIALIGVLNIINTISTNLILRTREFGTQRAVGMTIGQMKKMIVTEGVLYGVIGTLWGTAAGVVLSRVLFTLAIQVRGMLWKLPMDAIAIAGIGTLLATLLSTIVPLKRVEAMNIIEAIGREE